MTETRKVARPSYESDPARLRARIAILEATPVGSEREAVLAHLRRCLNEYAEISECDCEDPESHNDC